MKPAARIYSEQALFERWYRREWGGDSARCKDVRSEFGYEDKDMDAMWIGWQAGRSERQIIRRPSMKGTALVKEKL